MDLHVWAYPRHGYIFHNVTTCSVSFNIIKSYMSHSRRVRPRRHPGHWHLPVRSRDLLRHVITSPGRGAKCSGCSLVESVCLSARISRKPHVQTSSNFLCMLPVAVAAVLLWRKCNTLSTSGFVDDVMFHIMERIGQNQKLHVCFVQTVRPMWQSKSSYVF